MTTDISAHRLSAGNKLSAAVLLLLALASVLTGIDQCLSKPALAQLGFLALACAFSSIALNPTALREPRLTWDMKRMPTHSKALLYCALACWVIASMARLFS